MPYRQLCCISIAIDNREPCRRLAQVDTVVSLKDSSSRGAVLSVSWWEGRSEKGKRNMEVRWGRGEGRRGWNRTCIWM